MARNLRLKCLFIFVAWICAACAGGPSTSSTNSPTTSLIGSGSTALTLNPTTATVQVEETYPFTVTGGIAPYHFYLVTGEGAMNVNTGVYTAPRVAGTAQVVVEDSTGTDAYGTVTVIGIPLALTVSPSEVTVNEGQSYQFTAYGGSGSYTFSVASGIGTIDSETGVYTAPQSTGTASIVVTDTQGDRVNVTVTVTNSSAGAPPSAPLYREVSSSSGLHMSTLNSSEGAPDYVEQEILLSVYGSQISSSIVPLYRCGLGNAHFTTTDVTCEGVSGASLEIQMGWIDSVQQSGEVPLYRLHSSSGGDSMDSLSSTEGTQNGYVLDGVIGYAPATN